MVKHFIFGAPGSILKHLLGYLVLMNYALLQNGLQVSPEISGCVFFSFTWGDFPRDTHQSKTSFIFLDEQSKPVMEREVSAFVNDCFSRHHLNLVIVLLNVLPPQLNLSCFFPLQYLWPHSGTWISRLQMKRLVGFNQCNVSAVNCLRLQKWPWHFEVAQRLSLVVCAAVDIP